MCVYFLQARRKYKAEKKLKEVVFGTAPSFPAVYVPGPSVQASDPAPSSEPWPPQPWSVETLKTMLAGASSQPERTAVSFAF